MSWIIAVKLLPRLIRFQGAGRGVFSSTSSIAPSMLSLRRNAGVASPFKAEVGVPSSSNLLLFGVANWFSIKRFPADSGVFSPRARDSREVSSTTCSVFLLGVRSVFGSISASTPLFLLGVSAGSMSNNPRTMPSRCGVGPMTEGPWGDKNSARGIAVLEVSDSSLFLFIGVVYTGLGKVSEVRSSSGVRARSAGSIGVCEAVLSEHRVLNLLYSLYF
jgi:hypothetical protein